MCSDEDYIQHLIAHPMVASCTEMARLYPHQHLASSHDTFNRFLRQRRNLPDTLLQEAKPFFLRHHQGILIADDSTGDKPYMLKNPAISHHWSGKHRRAVRGFSLVSFLWLSNTNFRIPCEYEIYDKTVTKNEIFRGRMERLLRWGMRPELVCFDSWYAGLENLLFLQKHRLKWFTRLKKNRKVRHRGKKATALEALDIPKRGAIVYLPGYGPIKVFRSDSLSGDAEYWATDLATMSQRRRRKLARRAFSIEHYHRDLKQFCLLERCHHRSLQALRNHVGFALRAFLRLEVQRLHQNTSFFELKLSIIRKALRDYLTSPSYTLLSFA